MRNALLLALISTAAFAQVTQKVIYRGTLLEQGKPAADGEYVMKFSLYPAEGEATALSSAELTVAVRDAAFEADVGAIFAGAKGDLYLGLEIKRPGEAQFDQLSRSPVSAAPFAITAATALEAKSVEWTNVKNAPALLKGEPGVAGIAGPQGPMGSSVRVLVEAAGGNCPNGGFAIESADGLSFLCNGTTGPQGIAGLAGADGLMGPAGLNGADGLNGANGPMGPAGAIGPMGPQGSVGAIGPAGASGAVGAIGPMGPAGASGAVGAIGPMGPAGAVGAIGPVGPAGANGANGANGAVGAIGPVGPAGANGAVGAIGPMGPAGPNGANGAVGAIGPVGPAGGNGAVGAVGPAGANGAVGAIGPAGANGAVGAIGPMGPSGANGAIGPMGPAGADGTNGSAGPMGPSGSNGAAGTSVAGASEGPGLNCTYGGARFVTGATTSYVCNGTPTAGLVLRDANSVRLGLLTTFGSESSTVITANGHRIDLNINGTVQRAQRNNYSLPGCTGNAIVFNTFDNPSGSSAYNHPRLYGKVVTRGAGGQLYRPKQTLLDASGALALSTAVPIGSQDNWNSTTDTTTCSDFTSTANGFQFEPVTAADVGLPASIALPLQFPQ